MQLIFMIPCPSSQIVINFDPPVSRNESEWVTSSNRQGSTRTNKCICQDYIDSVVYLIIQAFEEHSERNTL